MLVVLERRVRELCEYLDGVATGAAPAIDAILSELGSALDAPAMNAYSVGVGCTHVVVDWIRTRGIAQPLVDDLCAVLEQTQFRPCAYSPVKPDPRQRNRPLTFSDLERLTGRPGVPPSFSEFLTRAGYARCDQLRVLVCDGPALLAWIGAYRPAPFTAHEKRIFRALVPALERRLRWERHLEGVALGAAALEAALEALPAPAFVVSRLGHVAYANRAGRARLEADRAHTADLLVDCVQQRDPESAWVARLSQPGVPHHYLIQLREGAAHLPARARSAAARWGLTPRQGDVLGLLAQGHANKSIAAILACGPRTVELHVSAILRKVGVESRAALVAAFWSGR